MSSKQPFKRHRFPAEIILCAVRMYLRYPLSYQDVTDLMAERGLDVDRSTVFRWVQKFGPELSRRDCCINQFPGCSRCQQAHILC
ncbi:transposase, IS6 family [Roseicitreum antarcticum]|uniref:Transposase, IS6 family n=1 Tax=Roseicitreum antarcticum TaxID=564137 RepID=A0A1H3EHP1_9RHOB|nr:transposase, IS6 family [Roseicitreum antarcticum]